MNNNTGIISGYASKFGEIDSHGEVVQKGAFLKSIEKFKKKNYIPKLLWQHDQLSPIGSIIDMYEDDFGLFVKCKLLTNLPKAQEAYLLLENKIINGFSIGYIIKNKLINKRVTILTEIDLLEISIVTFPSCPSATINEVKSCDLISQIQSISSNINNILKEISL